MVDRPARVGDIHEIAARMPHVTRIEGPKGNAIYQVGGKSFVFFRTPQPDAADPDTGARYPDVVMIWVESEADKLSLIQDPGSPFFTTDRFDGHPSVLVRADARDNQASCTSSVSSATPISPIRLARTRTDG